MKRGIQEIEANICDTDGDMIKKVKDKESGTYQYDEFYHGKGKDRHTSKESALKRAEEVRAKKIESLRKQLKKLEELKFD